MVAQISYVPLAEAVFIGNVSTPQMNRVIYEGLVPAELLMQEDAPWKEHKPVPPPNLAGPNPEPIIGVAQQLSIAVSCLVQGRSERSCTAPVGRVRCSR